MCGNRPIIRRYHLNKEMSKRILRAGHRQRQNQCQDKKFFCSRRKKVPDRLVRFFRIGKEIAVSLILEDHATVIGNAPGENVG
jgi:hypothetical protein